MSEDEHAARREEFTILLVDDDVDVLRLMSTMFEMQYANAIVKTAGNAMEALAIIKNSSIVDIVITDYNMPGMKGDELCMVIKKKFPAIVVVLMSALNSNKNVMFDKFFLKPIIVKDVFSFVETIIKR